MKAPIALALVLLFALFVPAHAQDADTTPPQVWEVEVQHKLIDTRNGDAVIEIIAHVTDNLSGVRFIQVDFRPLSGHPQTVTASTFARVDSDEHMDYYRAEMKVPQYSALGRWQVTSMAAMDHAGNWFTVTEDDGWWLDLYKAWTFVNVEEQAPAATWPPAESAAPSDGGQYIFLPTVGS